MNINCQFRAVRFHQGRLSSQPEGIFNEFSPIIVGSLIACQLYFSAPLDAGEDDMGRSITRILDKSKHYMLKPLQFDGRNLIVYSIKQAFPDRKLQNI